jgi:hypothetical protein
MTGATLLDFAVPGGDVLGELPAEADVLKPLAAPYRSRALNGFLLLFAVGAGAVFARWS